VLMDVSSAMASIAPTFEEYWLAFVRAHSRPSTRRLVYATMSAGIGAVAIGVLARRPFLLLLAPVIAFAPSLVAQKIAGNAPPLGSVHPVLHALSSLKMWHMTVSGTMESEVLRVMAEERHDDRASPERESPEPQYPRPNMVTDHTLH
jgi:hypothetical protein